MYSLADKTMSLLIPKIATRFRKTKNSLLKFDEINALGEFEDLYSALQDDSIKAYLNLAALQYGKYFDGKKKRKIDRDWLFEYVLATYNPVTGCLFETETARKEERAAEEFISKATKRSDGKLVANGNTEQSLKKDSSHWTMFVQQYADITTDEATMQAYKDSGVSKVKWVTQKDEKVCSECRSRNGKIYPIDKAPPKAHPRCRCFYVPVK